MRRLNTLFFIIMCLSVIALTGCSISGLKAVDRKETGIKEDINPFDFGDEFVRSEFGRKATSESPYSGSTETDNDSETLHKIDLLKKTDRQISSGKQREELSFNIYGYRVQIGIFENKESAEKRREYARSKVDMEVYVEFEAPFYRVRVGDFKTRNDAEKYVKILKNYGFTDSRCVFSKINMQ